MSEDRFLQKLIRSEARFKELLAEKNPPDPEKPMSYEGW